MLIARNAACGFISRTYWKSTVALFCLAIAAGQGVAQTPGRILVRAGKLVDVTTGNEATNKTIIVTGDKITAIADTSDRSQRPRPTL